MRTKLARIAALVLAAIAVATLIAPALIGRASVGDRRGTEGSPRIQPAGEDATFTPVFKAPLGLEGLTGDNDGNLYSAARGGDPCPVWRVPATGGDPVVVGNIAAPCSPSGIAFDHDGDLFFADGDRILTLTPSSENPPDAEIFATDVPGANGIAFDSRGKLWVSDGTTGQGRVWRVGPDGVAKEMFRVQPMAKK